MSEERKEISWKQRLSEGEREVPDLVRNRVEEVLSTITQKKKRPRRLLWTMSATAVLVMGLVGSAWVSPTVASALQDVPIIGDLFQRIGDLGLQQASLQGKSTELNLSASSQGIRLALTDLLYDGNRFVIGYQLQETAGVSGKTGDLQVEINGDSALYSVIDRRQNEDSYHSIGMLSITPNVPFHQQKLHLAVTKIGDVVGNWSFDVPVSKAVANRQTVPLTSSATYGEQNVIIDSVTRSVSSIDVSSRALQSASNHDSLQVVRFQVTDDQGRILQPVEQRTGSDEVRHSIYALYGDSPKSVTVRALEDTFYRQGERPNPENVMKKWEHAPSTLSQGDLGELQVTRLEKTSSKTLVYVTVKGQDPYRQIAALKLQDENGTTYESLNLNLIPNRVSEDRYDFLVEFPQLPSSTVILATTKLPSLHFLGEPIVVDFTNK